MGYLAYVGSLLVSLFTMIIVIAEMFSDPDSYIFKMFGNTEIYVCIGISIILLIIGIVSDKKADI